MAEQTKALAAGPVFDSMMALRQLARTVRSRAEWLEVGRYATAEEIALSDALAKPTACVAHSARHGLRCVKSRLAGMTCCERHSGSIVRVREKAKRRLAEMVDPVMSAMQENALQTENRPAAVRAGQDLLTRAGIGAEIELKAKAVEGRKDGGPRIEVRIGFLGTPDQPFEVQLPQQPVIDVTSGRTNE